MSVAFSRFSLQNLALASVIGVECILTMLAVIATYFLVFYSISEILNSNLVLKHQLTVIFFYSILITFIGMGNMKGTFIKIFLWLIVAVVFAALWKVGIVRIQNWYVAVLLPILVSSTIFSFGASPELLAEDKNIWLEDVEWNDSVHACICIRLKVQDYEASDIRIEILASNGVVLDEGENPLVKFANLRNNEEKIVRWKIMFDGVRNHSIPLYVVCSEKVSNKKIEIYLKQDEWMIKIVKPGLWENIKILLLKKHFSFVVFSSFMNECLGAVYAPAL
ncbi:MAG: hypothetical protein HXS52_09375 [Theionarchaea archaeon]|nr:hypothetical protein [Theionarchaea archaeon]MBU7038132.1 hypothetical protein [Theionarchaea archaeon]